MNARLVCLYRKYLSFAHRRSNFTRKSIPSGHHLRQRRDERLPYGRTTLWAHASRGARAVRPQDFTDFDLIIAMDQGHYDGLMKIAPADRIARIVKMGDYARAPWAGADVPDPYYTRDFAQTLDILENAIDGMLTDLGHSAL